MKMKMKKNLTIIVIAFWISGNAQETITPLENLYYTDLTNSNTTYYFKDVNNRLDKFVGVWKYETPTELFEITFLKVYHIHVSGNYYDRLNSMYKYVKNGVTIYDTYGLTSSGTNHVTGGLFKSSHLLDLFYSEPGTLRKWQARALIEYNAPVSMGAQPTLNWEIKTLDRITVGGVKVSPFKVQGNMVLTKQ